MSKQLKISDQNRKMYMIPGGKSYNLRAKNAIYISPITLRHELAKTIGAYMLKKWGDIGWDDNINIALKSMENIIKLVMRDFPKGKADFLTEAVPKTKLLMEKGATEKTDRRIDLVNLENNDWYEFETNPKIKKSKSITIYLAPQGNK